MVQRALGGGRLVRVLVAVVGTAAGVAAQGPRDTLHLSVADAVARAVRTSDESQLAALGMAIADAQRTSARAGALPQLTVNGQYSQVVRNARADIVGSVFGQAFNYAASATLSQPLFQGGRAVYAWRGAERVRTATRLDVAETRAALAVEAQRVYLSALFAARLAGIQRDGVALARTRVTQVEQLEAGGRAARYDVLRARVEAANLEPVALQAENERHLAELELRRLLNVPAEQALHLTTELDTLTAAALLESAPPPSTDGLDRPVVLAATLTLQARRDAIGIARAEFFPTVSMFVRSGFLALPAVPGLPTRWGNTSAESCPVGSPTTRVCQNNGWFRDESFGLQVSWPLFDAGRAKAGLDLATAQARIAEIQLRQRREEVAIEITRAAAELARAQAAFVARRATVGEASEAFTLASLRFERGIGTALEVSDAQLAFLTAQANEARAVYDLHLAVAERARAQGQPVPIAGTSTPYSSR